MRTESRHLEYDAVDNLRYLAVGGGGDAVVDRSDDGRFTPATVRALSHDLRHPCATIRALAAAIEVEADLPEKAKNRLRQIVAEARRVEELCGQVLTEAPRKTGVTRLDRVVRDIVAAHPRVSATASPVIARIEELDLRRILWNLIDNALRAVGTDGSVVVSVSTEDDEVVLTVSDDGPGFGAAAPGTAGLGLGIVTSLVERAGGRLEILSDGRGVAARVMFPRLSVTGYDTVVSAVKS